MAGVRIPGEIGYKPKYVRSVSVSWYQYGTLCLIMFGKPLIDSIVPTGNRITEQPNAP